MLLLNCAMSETVLQLEETIWIKVKEFTTAGESQYTNGNCSDSFRLKQFKTKSTTIIMPKYSQVSI